MSATNKRITTTRSIISKEMIGHPKGDLIHTLHVGVTGEAFGDLAYINRAMNSLQNDTTGSKGLTTKKSHAIKFGRKMKSTKNVDDCSQRTSTTSDEQICSLLPEEPFVDFGPSFFDEVMQALEERLPQYSVKSKYSDFVSSNECDFSDSDSSSLNKDDFSSEAGDSTTSNDSKHEGTEKRRSYHFSSDIVAQLTDNCGATSQSTLDKNYSMQYNSCSEQIINSNEHSEKECNYRQQTNDIQPRKESKWTRACRLPVNGMLLRTLGASSLSNASSVITVNSSNQVNDYNDLRNRYKISAPVQLISDSRLVKSSTIPVKPSTSQPPPLPCLASLGAKLTSAENIKKNAKYREILSTNDNISTKING